MKAEDDFTSTVDGAMGFARMHADPYDKYDGYSGDDERDYSNINCDDDDDRCNCSDPGCPCGGNKRGGL